MLNLLGVVFIDRIVPSPVHDLDGVGGALHALVLRYRPALRDVRERARGPPGRRARALERLSLIHI